MQLDILIELEASPIEPERSGRAPIFRRTEIFLQQPGIPFLWNPAPNVLNNITARQRTFANAQFTVEAIPRSGMQPDLRQASLFEPIVECRDIFLPDLRPLGFQTEK